MMRPKFLDKRTLSVSTVIVYAAFNIVVEVAKVFMILWIIYFLGWSLPW